MSLRVIKKTSMQPKKISWMRVDLLESISEFYSHIKIECKSIRKKKGIWIMMFQDWFLFLQIENSMFKLIIAEKQMSSCCWKIDSYFNIINNSSNTSLIPSFSSKYLENVFICLWYLIYASYGYVYSKIFMIKEVIHWQ